MAVENSSKKYLNFDGLAHYDSKIKAWAEGKYQTKGNYQPAGIYVADDAQGTVAKKINDSYSLWESFLAGLETAAPTLAELSGDHTWLTTNKSGLESASSWVSENGAGAVTATSWVSTNGAKAKEAGDFFDANKTELNRAFVNHSGGSIAGGKGYLPEAFGSLGTSVLGFSEMMKDYWTIGTDDILEISYRVSDADVNDKRTITQVGRLGLVETNLAWAAQTAIVATQKANSARWDIDALSEELTGVQGAVEGSDARLGRVGVLEQKIGKLTKATSWLGVVAAKPTSATVTINGASVTCSAGDIVTVVNDKPEETGLEYIYDGSAWVELGDSSGSRARIKTLEDTVGDANSGLVKDVNEIKINYVSKSEIVFATTAEIDTLFATA